MENELTGLQVHKFGGASIKDAAGIRNVARIVQTYLGSGPLILVVSAMGKTTNALEEIFDLAYQEQNYQDALHRLEEAHLSVARELLGPEEFDEDGYSQYGSLQGWLTKLRETLATVRGTGDYDEQYDQVISYGELLSSQLVYQYTTAQNELPDGLTYYSWLDARRTIRTNTDWRESQVDWPATQERLRMMDESLSFRQKITFTQGFVGGPEPVYFDDENTLRTGMRQVYQPTTTLGREGSDYSAAIFAYCLKAESVTIWKDVPGLLNADPKIFPDTVLYPEISYQETIEMAFYGASVIHPKTLKPLADRHIPLRVRSFLDPAAPGTLIHDCQHPPLVPAFIRKGGQCLLSFESKDFAFISEENLEVIFGALAQARLKINLMQNSAISFSVCTDYNEMRVQRLLALLQGQFRVQYNSELTLFTIKHYDAASIERLTGGRPLLLEQRTRSTFQFLVRE
jgi:aspartate kinase